MRRTGKNGQNGFSPNGQKGFTLVELLIAMAIGTMVLAAITAIYLTLTRSYTTEAVRAGAQQDVRAAMVLMCHDIRHAGLDPLGTAGGGFVPANTNATSIEFVADLDYDGVRDDNEQIRFFLNGRQLMQQTINEPAAVLIDDVTNLVFTYPDTDEVVITLTVQPPAGREGRVTRTLTERVALRNM